MIGCLIDALQPIILQVLSIFIRKSFMRRVGSLLLALLMVGCAVPPGATPSPAMPAALPADRQFAELGLGPIAQRLNPAESGVQTQYGWFCLPAGKRYFTGDQPAISWASLDQAMRVALEPLNYKLRPRVGSVFSNDRLSRLYLGGTITAVRANICHPFTGSSSLNIGNPGLAKGNALIEISWELFDSTDKKVLFATTIQGSFDTASTVDGGLSALLLRATANNVANLAASPEFRKAIMNVSPQSTAQVPSSGSDAGK
jgi:hypothetical protein